MKKPDESLKPLPPFASEAEEAASWLEHDSAEYLDWSKAQRVRFPNLKPSTKAVSLRLPLWLLDELKMRANIRDIPYQSYMKMLPADALKGTQKP